MISNCRYNHRKLYFRCYNSIKDCSNQMPLIYTISIVRKILSNQRLEIFFYLKQAVEDGSSAAGHVDDGAGEPGKKYLT
jgi:hypothetical protein